jgi:hypothetical protein
MPVNSYLKSNVDESAKFTFNIEEPCHCISSIDCISNPDIAGNNILLVGYQDSLWINLRILCHIRRIDIAYE